jgi:hypothetical protein
MPVPHEARQYASNFAKGGEIRHFVNDGLVNLNPTPTYTPIEKPDTQIVETIDPMTGDVIRVPINKKSIVNTNLPNKPSQADVRKSEERIAAKPPILPQAGLTNEEMMQGSNRAGTWNALNNDQTTGREIPQAPQTGLASFMEQLNAHQGKIDKQRQEDKNMALLTAGLGMLGGTSQYAFENIGKGALAGVQHLSEANKLNAAQQNALDRNMLYAHHYQGVEEAAKQNAAANQGLRLGEHIEKQRANNLSAIKSMKDDARAIAIAGLKAQGMIGMDMDDPNTAMKIEQATKAILANEPAYSGLYRSTFGVDYGAGAQRSFEGFSVKERKK